MGSCIVLPKIGKLLKLCLIVVITFLFPVLCHLRMHRICADVAKQVPLDRLLIETDSPYLAPVPYRGKTNEPKYVPYVAKALSDVYDKSVEIAMITSQNFENLLKAI